MKQLIDKLKRSLPAQAPLKDFIATNTLFAFQHLPFHRGLEEARQKLGVNTYLDVSHYQFLLRNQEISENILDWVLYKKGLGHLKSFLDELIPPQTEALNPRQRLRDCWKTEYQIDLITHVQPILFRHLSHYLDQGISFFPVPFMDLGFWGSLQQLEQQSFFSVFREKKSGRSSQLLLKTPEEALEGALKLLVGDENLFESYLFELIQEHPGWSGLISVLEDHPHHLNLPRQISLLEALAFELLLELDFVDHKLNSDGRAFQSLSNFKAPERDPVEATQHIDSQSPIQEVLHESMEWTYYQDLFTGLRENIRRGSKTPQTPHTQVYFCIDDRCCSLRRHLEEVNPHLETLGTPGFFGVEFFYKSETEKFPVKLCPAPLQPQFLVRGYNRSKGSKGQGTDFLLSKITHTLFGGWLVSQTLGLLSAVRLLTNIFSPALSPKVAASFRHTDDRIQFRIRRESEERTLGTLKLGFSQEEMADRVYGLLSSCGTINKFSPLIIMLGHGSSTVNNPHYAAYDCGACSGRPGSINARIFCSMANDPEVRELLQRRGISIPQETTFVPALFDTTRDEVFFYDIEMLNPSQSAALDALKADFFEALLRNSKERSRRFEDIPLEAAGSEARNRLQKKSVSIFEPRQEFTHAGNAACIIGPRDLTRGLFLDRRCFLNSYDPRTDSNGDILCSILKAAVPVCGGINLQYFFSRVDNEKLGSGTKLPHNVVGLLSVANGTEGDLRPGLPLQMVEWHDPLRLMILVYQEAPIALQAARKIAATFEWIQNEWVRYACISPSTQQFFIFESGEMKPFDFFGPPPQIVQNSLELVSKSRGNLKVALVGRVP